MAKVKDPILFSSFFNVSADLLDSCGLIDPFLNVDTELFIDPVLLDKSSFEIINNDSLTSFREHFSKLIRLLSISKAENDAAWKAARKLLDLQEPPENGLGFGGSRRAGASRPDEVREQILRTAKEIIELGSEDPEMISLMGFFEEGVGPDTISDFTTRIIMPQLCYITQEFCIENSIPVYDYDSKFKLPVFEKDRFILLVPKDIVRDLPISSDWSDVNRAVMENAKIRDRVNLMLATITEPTVTEKKEALRSVALESVSNFQEFLEAIKETADYYDANEDALGYYAIRKILASDISKYKLDSDYDIKADPATLRRFVLDILDHFKHHVEHGNLWEELWIDGKPKKERAAQLIFYAIADVFCRANNIDISPEANMGGGPIDFKFSQGYCCRVLVEIKRSSGKVVSGYEKQLEIYKNASRTEFGIYVVIDYGDAKYSYETIRKIRRNLIEKGESASDILVIDATTKESASVRKHIKSTLPLNFGDS